MADGSSPTLSVRNADLQRRTIRFFTVNSVQTQNNGQTVNCLFADGIFKLALFQSISVDQVTVAATPIALPVEPAIRLRLFKAETAADSDRLWQGIAPIHRYKKDLVEFMFAKVVDLPPTPITPDFRLSFDLPALDSNASPTAVTFIEIDLDIIEY